MTVSPSQNNGLHASLVATRVPNQARSVLAIDTRKHRLEQSVEEMLSSALRASDNEFDQIIHEVEEISASLKADVSDPQTCRVAAHPAVWRAVRQALLDRELRQLALTDDLTCLYNRRGFFAAATHQMKLARRNQQTLLLSFAISTT